MEVMYSLDTVTIGGRIMSCQVLGQLEKPGTLPWMPSRSEELI